MNRTLLLPLLLLVIFASYGEANNCNYKDEKGVTHRLSNGESKTDSCGLECSCNNGEVACCRVRKDYVSMSLEERTRFNKAWVKKARESDEFDRLVALHAATFLGINHNSSMFLPWHRFLILEMENVLRKEDCRITIPYWEARLDAAFPNTSKIWRPSGIGGNGNPADTPLPCITTGPFRKGKFVTSPSAESTCLYRRWSNTNLVTAVEVAMALRVPADQYDEFRFQVDHGFHDAGHGWVGGVLPQPYNPTVPEFFLWHGFIDKVWAEWQAQGKDYLKAYQPGPFDQTPEDVLPGSKNNEKTKEFFDVKRQGHKEVCAVWKDNDSEYAKVIKKLNKMPLSKLQQIPFIKSPPTPDFILTLIGCTPETIDRIREHEANLAPYATRTLEELRYSDFASKMGFLKVDYEAQLN